jgi:hypothetical protein
MIAADSPPATWAVVSEPVSASSVVGEPAPTLVPVSPGGGGGGGGDATATSTKSWSVSVSPASVIMMVRRAAPSAANPAGGVTVMV